MQNLLHPQQKWCESGTAATTVLPPQTDRV